MLGLIQIQNPFENFFGKSFENKKKRQSLPSSLSLSFWPNRPCFSVGPAGRLAFPPLFPLRPKPSAPPKA